PIFGYDIGHSRERALPDAERRSSGPGFRGQAVRREVIDHSKASATPRLPQRVGNCSRAAVVGRHDSRLRRQSPLGPAARAHGFCLCAERRHDAEWTPQAQGTAFELPKLLEPIAPYRSKVLVLSGLTHNGGRALGDGPGDHARAASTFLTGVHPKKTS